MKFCDTAGRLVLVLILAAGAAATQAAGEEDDDGWKRLGEINQRLTFKIGGFSKDLETEVQIGTGNIVGAIIRAEDLLGLDENSTDAFISGRYQFSRRHSLDFGYQTWRRTGLRVLDESLQVGDKEYQVGALLETELRNDFFLVSYRYSLYNTEKIEAGVSFGLSTVNILFAAKGVAAYIPPGSDVEVVEVAEEDGDLIAPVPAFGFRLEYAIRKNVFLSLRADFLDIGVDKWKGQVFGVNGAVEWFPWKNVGIGAGRAVMDMSYEQSYEDGGGIRYNLYYGGWMLYLALAF